MELVIQAMELLRDKLVKGSALTRSIQPLNQRPVEVMGLLQPKTQGL